jgi:hypothetical protein
LRLGNPRDRLSALNIAALYAKLVPTSGNRPSAKSESGRKGLIIHAFMMQSLETSRALWRSFAYDNLRT